MSTPGEGAGDGEAEGVADAVAEGPGWGPAGAAAGSEEFRLIATATPMPATSARMTPASIAQVILLFRIAEP
jgi:hypothetical protein